MDAKELRIGNLVEYANQETIVLDILRSHAELGYFTDSIGFERKYNEFKPLRLTEKWLIDFGFKRTYFGRKINDFHLEAGSRTVKTDELHSFSLELIPEEKYLSVNYVHELQNLYFVLTGEELTRVDG